MSTFEPLSNYLSQDQNPAYRTVHLVFAALAGMILLATSSHIMAVLCHLAFRLYYGVLLRLKNVILKGVNTFVQRVQQTKGAENGPQPSHSEAHQILNELQIELLQDLLKMAQSEKAGNGTEMVDQDMPSLLEQCCAHIRQIRVRRGWFRIVNWSREEDWCAALKNQLKPTFDEFTDKITDRMTASLHEWLPDIHPQPPKFDTLIGMLLTHARIKLNLQPIIEGVMANVEEQWIKVSEPVKEERRHELVEHVTTM
ncbi:hypothetical protein AAF712_015996 [Marasmius tenuissimus]|uniref:Uncharacterized protein n=1 Tax=Marasmius tenuissimus TaxID=585030 RepID=A0ABR2Z804_9AGAR|nr:hypothetical protein PM082_016207 [Marasmius tenuissimus]